MCAILKKTEWFFLVIGCILVTSYGISDEVRFLKVGSWATYKMGMKVGGAAGKMMDTMASGDEDLPPGMTPEMVKMIPPAQLAKLKEQMKKNKPKMDMQKKMMQSAKDPGKGMNTTLKIQVVGQEIRAGKPYVWAEMIVNMDVGKMLESIPPDMKDDKGKNIKQEAMKKLAEAGFPGGKVHAVIKMLLAKPPSNLNTVNFDSFKPIEIIQKMGDKPTVKMGADELAVSNGEAGKTFAVKQTQDLSSSESSVSQSVQEKNIDVGAKATALRAGLDPLKEFVGVVKGIPGVGQMPQTQLAAASLRGLDSMLGAFEDLNIKIKKVTETKSETTTKGESETETTSKVISQKTEVLGVEKVETKPAGTLPALHAQMVRVSEQTSKSKTESETEVKMEQTTTKSRKIEGQGGGAKLLRAMGLDKTKVKKGLDIDVKSNVDVKTENTVKLNHVTDYYMSPSIPGLGLVKLVEKQESEMGDSNVNIDKMNVNGNEYNPSANPQMQMMMRNSQAMGRSAMKSSPYGDLSKSENTTEFDLDSMGDAGAKPEL